MANPQKLSTELYATDGTTLITALEGAYGMGFLDEYNGLGRGHLSINVHDADQTQLTRDRYIKCSIPGAPDPIFAFKIEARPKKHPGGRAKEKDEVIISGRGWGCDWEDVTVASTVPDGADLDPAWRNWWFADPNFPNAGMFGPPTEVYEYKDGVAAARRVVKLQSAIDSITDEPIYDLFPAPVGFPWPTAPHNGDGFAPTPVYVPTYWITADGAPSEESIGWHFFIGGFGLAGQQSTKLTATGDNLFLLILQGVPLLGEDADTLIWMSWLDTTLELPAGFWNVSGVVENVSADVAFNPAGFLASMIAMAVYPGEVETSETIGLLQTNADDWVSYFSADEWPGYTPGQMLDQFVAEAVTRGGLASYVGGTYTDFTDSDGGAWDSADPDTELEFIPLLASRIGDTGVDLLDQAHQEGWIDWHFTPNIHELDVWSQGTGGVTTSVTVTPGLNVAEDGIQRSAPRPYANALNVQWAKGHVWVVDQDEIDDGRPRIEDVYSTDATTVTEAQRLGRIELRRRTRDSRSAIRIALEPVDDSDTPYIGFQIGDFIIVPDADDIGTESVQVLSIGCDTDDKGYVIWLLECNEPWLEIDQAQQKLLRSLGGKSQGTVADLGITHM